MKKIRMIFSRIITGAVAVMFVCTAAIGATNIPAGDVDEYGTWATPHNREVVIQNLTNDIVQFHPDIQPQLVQDFVPIEAKVGLAFMEGMSLVGRVLDSSLVRFVIIFIIIAYIFWIAFEAYNLIVNGGDVKKLVMEIVKKTGLILIWTIILNQGAAQVFMWAMGPIISVGTALSDMILNSIAVSAGANLPDTCAAIREYAAANIGADTIINASAAADIMCVPTRLSGFFYTGLAAGWAWMRAGIGHSAFTFIAGAILVVTFVICIWKFALMAFGVIADLFLTVLMLPFTAIAETVGKTSYKGIMGDIFNGFLGIFSTQSLATQISRFVNAALYFVSLSIVVGLGAGILSGVVDADLAARIPTLENDGIMVTLLSVALVAYLLTRGGEIAGKLGGSIDASLGDKFGNDITKWGKNLAGRVASLAKTIREDGKKS